MPVLRLFAAAREAAGLARAEIGGATVGEVLDAARAQFGERFVAVLDRSRVWVNGEPATPDTPVTSLDVVAVLPPVSGGAVANAVTSAAPAPPRTSPRPPPRILRPSPPRLPEVETVAPPSPLDAPGADAIEPAPEGTKHTDEAAPNAVPGLRGPNAVPGLRGPNAVPGLRGPNAVPGLRGPNAVAGLRGPNAVPGLRGPNAVASLAGPDTIAEPAGPKDGAERRRSAVSRLAVVYGTARPHGRLGLVWAAITVAVIVAGPPWLAAWLGAAALMGASQAAGARRTLDQRPPPPFAALVAGGLVGASLAGARYVVIGAAAGLVLAVLARTVVGNRKVAINLSFALVIGVAIGTAAASAVLVRSVDIGAALFLFACVCTYDASAYLVGTGASSAWEGPTAGIVALLPVTVLAAVILPSPPFPSGSPLALGLVAAVLAPLGPLVGTALLGDRNLDAPGLRRLDSLILLAPAWAYLVSTVLK